jgi:hypothetical protein
LLAEQVYNYWHPFRNTPIIATANIHRTGEGSMRLISGVAFVLGLLLFAVPAFAGQVDIVEGRIQWRPTQCSVPAPPPSLVSVDPETRAEDMNTRVTLYNQYVQAASVYMNCLSNESQADANAASKAIVASGTAAIKDVQDRLQMLNPAAKNAK